MQQNRVKWKPEKKVTTDWENERGVSKGYQVTPGVTRDENRRVRSPGPDNRTGSSYRTPGANRTSSSGRDAHRRVHSTPARAEEGQREKKERSEGGRTVKDHDGRLVGEPATALDSNESAISDSRSDSGSSDLSTDDGSEVHTGCHMLIYQFNLLKLPILHTCTYT